MKRDMSDAAKQRHAPAACIGKYDYGSYIAANRKAKWVSRRSEGQDIVHPYRCPICRGWHIGSSSQ